MNLLYRIAASILCTAVVALVVATDRVAAMARSAWAAVRMDRDEGGGE